MEVILTGSRGHSVVKTVLVVYRIEPDNVIIQNQCTEGFALDILMRPDFAICFLVLVGIFYI